MLSPSASGYRTVGETAFTLTCSVDVVLQSDSPSPMFEWFFGSSNTTIPASSDITESVVTNSGNTYTSTLHFPQLKESHTGEYTCRFRGNERLAAAAVVAVNFDPGELQHNDL